MDIVSIERLEIERLERENVFLRKRNLLLEDQLNSQKCRIKGRPSGSTKYTEKVGDKQVRVPIPLLAEIRQIIQEWRVERRREIEELKKN